eukprot:TRINITY_DN1418_c0_g1_i10.p1 TRINITY_DN1418_c0_g1~~TRINITY_DN1418_c0_g1_i10.p1  ORF type:complete len:475 (-),score=34.52 TRINITY_DN1418_c0_g1_i10:1884-3308(-)
MTQYPFIMWVAVLGALFGSIQFGFHQGILNTAWNQLAVVFAYYDVNSGYTSIINFSYLVGATLGSLGAGSVADGIGPKMASIMICGVFVVGGLISSFSIVGKIGVLMFSVGRFISGIGAGSASLLAPRLVTEIAPVSFRGILGTMAQLFCCLGIVISFLAGLPYQTEGSQVSENQWRYMLFLSVIIPIIQAVILFFVPESFEWYKMRGDFEAAEAAGRKLHGTMWVPLSSKDPLLEKGNDVDSGAPVSYKQLFTVKYSYFLSLGIAIVVFQQLSGINTVVMYSTTVYKEVHLNNAVLASVISGLINVLGTVAAAFMVEKTGRKVLILISHAGMFVCFAYIAILQWLPIQADSNQASYSAFAAINLYVIFFAIGAGPIPWLYLAEMMPSQIKGKAAAIATSLNWTFCIIIIASFPLLLAAIGTAYSYGIFAIFNVLAFVYLYFYMVETKQISIEEIEKKLLRDEVPKTNKAKAEI